MEYLIVLAVGFAVGYVRGKNAAARGLRDAVSAVRDALK